MNIDENEFICKYRIEGASYVGVPKNNTVMFVANKVSYLLNNLKNIHECLIFIENGIILADTLPKDNCYFFTDNPQRDFARYINKFAIEKDRQNKLRHYKISSGGYYIGENVRIGKNVYIEPMCLIDHDVTIGDNTRILSGAVIRNAIIGKRCLINEKAVIGNNAFNMAKDENGNLFRMPTLGKVVIGDEVEIGAMDNISAGAIYETIISDYVKLDAFIMVGHDANIGVNVEAPAHSLIGAYSNVGKGTFIGMNASIKNRINIGNNSVISMGSVVMKNVEEDTTVAGNPARVFQIR